MRRAGEDPPAPTARGQSEELADVDAPEEPLLEPPEPEPPSDEPPELDESELVVPEESDEVLEELAGVVDDELPRLSFL